MKLHLPYILRAAVLASVALSSVHHTHAAGAVYDYMIVQESFGPKTTVVDGELGAILVQHNLVDARAQSWVLNVTASNLSPDNLNTSDILSLGGSLWVTVNNSKYEVTLDPGVGFGIFVAPDSDILLAYHDGRETVTHVLSSSSNWKWSSVANVTCTLSWDAENGSLTLEGGSVQRREDGSISNFKRIEGLHYNLPSSWLHGSGDLIDTLTFISGAGATITTNLYTQGTEDTDAGWLVSGHTVLGVAYDDKIAGADTKREMGADENVQFVGASGVIYAKETTTFGNAVRSSINLQNIQAGSAIGFGAGTGAELTVTTATNAINNAAGDALVPELNIVGEGVVTLRYQGGNAANLSQVKVNIDKDSTLKIDDSDTTSAVGARINLSTGIVGSNASIVKAGQATDLTIVTESGEKNSVISLKKLENENGSIVIEGAGSLKVEDVKSGGISISGGASLSTTGEVKIAGEARVKGTLNTSQSDRLTASVVTVQGAGVVQAKEIVGNAVNVAGVTVEGGSTAARTLPWLLKGNVIVNSNGIVADEIAEGTSIEFSADSEGTVTAGNIAEGTSIKFSDRSKGTVTAGNIAEGTSIEFSADSEGTVTAGKMAGVNMTAGGTQVLTNAGTNSSIVMSGTSTVARGTITAAAATVTGKYELAAQQLKLEKLDSNAVSVEGDDTDYAVLENVSIYNAQTGAGDNVRVMKASGITAKTVTVQGGSVLIGADVKASDGLIVGNRAALDNVSIQSGTLKNEGKVVLNNVTFKGGAASYGGADGHAIEVDPEMYGVDNVQITGTLEGDKLVVDNLVVNAEELRFGSDGVSYEIMEGDGISYKPSASNYQLNIESFVRAELSYDEATGVVTLSGYEDEEGIKNELNSTPNRQEAMGSLNAALPGAEAGSPLAAINEYIGHVNRYGLTERQQVLDAASGASLVALADAQRRGLRDSQRNIRNRVIQMGGGTSKGLTTDWQYAGLQAWAQADAGYTSIDGSQDECGYDFDTTGATVGANVDLTANLVVGMSFSASYGDIDVKSADSATVETSSYYLNFFGRYQSNRWVHMLIFTVGMDEMDTERRVLGYKASGSTEGTSYSLYYELGYTIGLDYEFNHIIQPLVSVTLTSAEMSNFEENGSIGNAGLRYEGDDFVYGQLAVGARYQGVLYESVHERSAVVEARAVVTHDIGDKTDEATLSYMGGNNFSVNGVDATGLGFEIGAGLSIPVEQHTTLFADAEYTYAPEYTGIRANIGVRYDF